MTNTKNTKGQITKFGNNADLAGLDDGTSKLHSGILKALFAIATGNYVSAIGTNGITQSQNGGYTRFTVNGDIVFYRNGERFVISGNLNLDYGSGDAADSSTDRYDFLVLKSDNTLGFRKGSITGSDTNVGVLEDKDVPIAIIKVDAGAAADVTTRHLQLFTAADGDKSISITNSAADLTGDSIIQNLLVDKDIIFKGNDNNGTNGANISALTLDMSEAGKAIFNAGAEFKKDVTIYEDANNADVSLSLGTSATEGLTITVYNGSSNKTAEVISFATATASGTANHGKMIFDVDGANIATIDDGGIDLAAGKTFSINGTDIVSSPITALNNATANELVTVGSTTTELDSEANLTFDGTDLKLLKDANNADVSLTLGTSDAESLKIQVLNGGSNKTAEEVHFSTATASSSTDAGKMVFDIDGTDKLLIDDAGIDVTGAITATTSITGGSVLGILSVTGAAVNAQQEMQIDGLEKTAYEVVDQNLSLPQPSFTTSIIYVNDISAILGTAGAGPAANNQILMAPPTNTLEYKIRNIHPTNTITLEGVVFDNNSTAHPYVTANTTITLAPSQGVHLQGIVDGPVTQACWMITGTA